MDLTGHTFQGKYDILERLTEDGSTETYKARHSLLDTEHIVKIMKPHAISSSIEVKEFQIEMQELAQNPSDKIGIAVDFSILIDGRPYAILVPPSRITLNFKSRANNEH